MARGFQYQSKTDPPQQPETAGWQQGWDLPPRIAAAIALVASGLFAAPVQPEAAPVTIDWHQALSEPQRVPGKPTPSWDYSPFVTPAAAPVGSVPSGVSTNISFEVRIQYQGYTAPVFIAPEEVTADKWFNPLSEPQRDKLRLLAGAQPYQFLVQAAPFEEAVTESRWHQPWSEPVRLKPGLAATQQQTLAFYPNPTVSFGWFGSLSDPSVLAKAGLRAALQQAAIIDPYALTQPEVVSESKWHQAWSEPVRLKPGLSAALQQTLGWNPVFAAPEVVTVDKWWEPWSDPTRQKWSPKTYPIAGFLAPQPQVSFGWYGGLVDPAKPKKTISAAAQQSFLVDTDPVVSFGWVYQLSEPVRFKRGLYAPYHEEFWWGDFTPEVSTPDKWFEPLSEPVRTRRFNAASQQVTAPTDTDPVVSFGWLNPLSVPTPPKSGLQARYQQFFTISPYALTQPETVTEDRWHTRWQDTVPAKKSILAGQQQFLALSPFPITGETVTADKWIYPLSEPVRVKKSVPWQQFTTLDPYGLTQPEKVTESRWHQPWSEPVRIKSRISAASQQTLALHHNPTVSFGWFGNLSAPTSLAKSGLRASLQQFTTIDPYALTQPERVSEDKWHQPWSEPQRSKRGLLAPAQLTSVVPTVTERVTVDKWFESLSEPARLKRGLSAVYQAALAFHTNPSVSFGWFGRLTEPVRTKSRVAWQQPLALHSNPTVSFGWFGSLSDPTREKPGLSAALQQYFTSDPTVPAQPVTVGNWFSWFSEPARQKPGLGTGLQQDQAWPPRLLPTSIIVTMAVVEENNDTFEAAIVLSNRAVRCLVSIEEVPVPGNDPTSIEESE